MNGSEKRGAMRVHHISEVVCEGEGTRLIARITDLSVSGVFIRSQLCCEAGSILKVKFSVISTEIETLGEVCYSMPQIGMGLRFLDLKPEYRAAIESLVESHHAHEESENVKARTRSVIRSGVEPVDKLLGGLGRGHLYLAHGDTSGKSLFGLAFLIEGLKNGQTAALITHYSNENAVRRFARLGYNCTENLRSGTLVIFTYPDNIAEQVFRLRHLAPLLHELEPILHESSPERVVFDPVNTLLAREAPGDIAERANEFAVWIRSFGATVVLIANGERGDVIESLTPSVKESIRFEVRESSDRVVRYIAFEKSPSIPDQSVRVDPSRGISLLEGQPNPEPPDIEIEMIGNVEQRPPGIDAQTLGHESEYRAGPATTSDSSPADFSMASSSGHHNDADGSSTLSPIEAEESHAAFFAMLDELQSFTSSLDPDAANIGEPHPWV